MRLRAAIGSRRRGSGALVRAAWVVGALLVVFVLGGPATAFAGGSSSTKGSSEMGSSSGMGSSNPMAGMEMPGPGSKVSYASTLKPRGWVVSASSSARGHSAQAVLALRKSRFWESAVLRAGRRLPQSVTVTFPKPLLVSGVTYVPHGSRDVIGRFVVRVSTDGKRFGAPVAYGTWQANAFLKRVGWVPRRVRAVRITVESLSSRSDRAVEISRLIFGGVEMDQAKPAKEPVMQMGKRGAVSERANDDTATSSTSPSVIGEWGPTIAFPLIPVAAALIPGDKLLVWSADDESSFNSNDTSQYTQTALLNLATGVVTQSTVSNTAHDMFCPGASILPNGDVLVTGGIGDTDTSIYSPVTNSWTAGPQLNIGRGYQGQTTLPDGQAFVLGGSWSGAIGGKLGEVYSPTAGWRELTNVPANPIYTNDVQGAYRADNHGWFIATSGDRVFQAGPSEEMHWISTTGSGSITDAGPRGDSGDEMNGNAVLYDDDPAAGAEDIFTVGGAPSYGGSGTDSATGSYATNVANVVNISSNTPVVTPTASMSYDRSFANSVVLPGGNIFTVGGQSYAVPFTDTDSDLYPEMWDPGTGQWTIMAEQAEPRNYHSVAVLLPDGTVFSGGGGLCGSSCSTNHPDGQIFYPPYLFNSNGSMATRPVISSAPSSAQTGQTISVTTNGPVSSFDLIRYGEATHTVDNDQRRIPLPIVSSSGDTYQLTIPSDPGVALPGPYMLFAINSSGTPSVSATISVTTLSAATPTSTYGQRIDADGPAVYWPLSDPAGSTSASDLSGNRDSGVYSPTGITYGTASPVEGSSGEGITLNGGSVVQSQPQDTLSSYSEELWFNTTSTSGGSLATFGDSANGTGSNASQDRSIYMTAAGNLAFGTWTGQTNTIQSPATYNNGKWHFVVATQSSDGMHLYVDGQLVASNTTTGAQPYTGYWQLGGTTNTGWPNRGTGAFTGSISDAALFTHELTANQIQTEYQASPASSSTSGSTPPSTGNAYQKEVISTGPSAYWPLADASGSAASDESGNGNTGVYSKTGITYGVSSPVESTGGLGITLAASGQIVSAHAMTTPTTYSEELWFKTTSTTGGNLATFGDSVNGTASNTRQDRSIYMTSAGNLVFATWPQQTITIQSPGTYNDGNWHFVVVTQSTDGMHLYVDGKLVASNTTSGAQSYTGYWQLGGTTNTGWPNRGTGAFTGSISDAALYLSTELTGTQIQAEYQASPASSSTTGTTPPSNGNAYQKDVISTGPSAYWPLADASGSAASDESGNGNTGVYSKTGITYGVSSPVESTGGLGITLAATGQVVSAHAVTTPTTYSEELWFKTSTTTGGNLATFGDSVNGTASNTEQDRSIYMTAAGNLVFATWPQQTITIQSPATYNNGKWHFVVATQSSDGMHLYVDGQLVASNTTTGAQPYTGYWQLGGTTNTGWPNRGTGAFTGSISDAALYLSTELTASQVSTLYSAAG